MTVHNHGPSEGKGLACNESIVDGKLRGECMSAVSPAIPDEVREFHEEAPTSADQVIRDESGTVWEAVDGSLPTGARGLLWRPIGGVDARWALPTAPVTVLWPAAHFAKERDDLQALISFAREVIRDGSEDDVLAVVDNILQQRASGSADRLRAEGWKAALESVPDDRDIYQYEMYDWRKGALAANPFLTPKGTDRA